MMSQWRRKQISCVQKELELNYIVYYKGRWWISNVLFCFAFISAPMSFELGYFCQHDIAAKT
jgi:hypothetical protein